MFSIEHWLNGDFARPPSLEVVSEAPRSSGAFFCADQIERSARCAPGARGPAEGPLGSVSRRCARSPLACCCWRWAKIQPPLAAGRHSKLDAAAGRPVASCRTIPATSNPSPMTPARRCSRSHPAGQITQLPTVPPCIDAVRQSPSHRWPRRPRPLSLARTGQDGVVAAPGPWRPAIGPYPIGSISPVRHNISLFEPERTSYAVAGQWASRSSEAVHGSRGHPEQSACLVCRQHHILLRLGSTALKKARSRRLGLAHHLTPHQRVDAGLPALAGRL